jgi:NAD(P)-dependent dehydrogenase (short-subunit alcohol dehydrogenase family)
MSPPAHYLIVGGTRGLGRACVERLLQEGCRITVLARHLPAAVSTQSLVRYYVCDVQEEVQLRDCLPQVTGEQGELTGMVSLQRFRGQEGSWDGNLSSSLTATRILVEQALPHFQKDGDRSIVVMGSSAAQAVADEQTAGYHAAKAGLLGLCRYYAFTLGPLGIRVNSVSPGTVIKEESRAGFASNPELCALFERIIPLRRMGTSQEVANVVRFLLSSEASFISGQDLVVDGGSSLHWQESLARALVGHQFKG